MTQTVLATALALAALALVGSAAIILRLAASAARASSREAMLRAVVDQLPDAVLVLDSSGTFLVVNPAAKRVFGETLGARVDAHWTERIGAHTHDGARLLAVEESALSRALAGEFVDGQHEVLRAAHHADTMHMSVTSRPMRDASGSLRGAVAVFRDITETQRAERARRQTEERFRRLAEATFEGITLSVDGILLDSNDTFARMFGYEPEEVLGRDATDFCIAQERATLIAHIQNGYEGTYETVGLRKDGNEMPLEIRGRMLEIDGMRLRITAMRDITERKRTEAKLAEQTEALRMVAIHDELTAIYNRRGFLELGGQQLRLAEREPRAVALIFADVNGLKKINDELGHEQGDQVIRDAASVLQSVARSADLVARLGGDEIVVLASGLLPEHFPAFEARLNAAIVEHNTRAPRPFKLSMSVGVAYRAAHERRTLEELLAEADQQMYRQKRDRQLTRDAAE